jgi:hypothetical protein
MTTPMSRMAWITTMESRLGKEKAHRKLLSKAGELGTQAHAMIEWTLHKMLGREVGQPPRIQDKAQWAFMAWEDWAKSVQLKPILIEQVVYSRRYGFAGTLDLLAEIKGKLTVVDWKTGKAVYDEAHLQNAAYRVAIREMGHANPVAGMMVRLPKVETDPEFEVVEAEPEAPCFEAFLHVQKVWTWMQIGEAKYQAKKKAAADLKSFQNDAAFDKGQVGREVVNENPKDFVDAGREAFEAGKRYQEKLAAQVPAGVAPPQAAAKAPDQTQQAPGATAEALPQGEHAVAPPVKAKRARRASVPKAQLNPPVQKNGQPLPLAPDDPLNKPAYVATDADCPF